MSIYIYLFIQSHNVNTFLGNHRLRNLFILLVESKFCANISVKFTQGRKRKGEGGWSHLVQVRSRIGGQD